MQWMKKTIPHVLRFLGFFYSLVFLFTLSRGDTFVNYGFSYAIRMGEIPYLDFNMVIPPFAPFFYSIGLFFYNNILMLYLEQAILLTLLYHLLEKKLGKKTPLYFFFFLLPYPLAMVSTIFPGYNFLLVFFFLLFLICLEKEKHPILLGVLLGILFTIKQTVGLLLFLPTFWFLLKKPKKFFQMLGGFSIPCFVLLIYLFCTKSFFSFFDLCFLGLFDFQKSNQQINMFYLVVFLLGIGYLFYRIVKKPRNVLLYYALFFGFVVYPIVDYYHVCLFLTIPFFFFIDSISYREKGMKVFAPIFGIICILWGIVTYSYFDDITISNYPGFTWVIQGQTYQNDITSLLSYVDSQDQEVIYFMRGSENYFYKILHREKITYFDLPNYGNYGKDGIQKMKKKIDETHHVLYVLDSSLIKEQDVNQQYIVELGEYVKENSQLIRRIGVYEIYERK